MVSGHSTCPTWYWRRGFAVLLVTLAIKLAIGR